MEFKPSPLPERTFTMSDGRVITFPDYFESESKMFRDRRDAEAANRVLRDIENVHLNKVLLWAVRHNDGKFTKREIQDQFELPEHTGIFVCKTLCASGGHCLVSKEKIFRDGVWMNLYTIHQVYKFFRPRIRQAPLYGYYATKNPVRGDKPDHVFANISDAIAHGYCRQSILASLSNPSRHICGGLKFYFADSMTNKE